MNNPTYIRVTRDIRTWIYSAIVLYALITADAPFAVKILLFSFAYVSLLNSVVGYNWWVSVFYKNLVPEGHREGFERNVEIHKKSFFQIFVVLCSLLFWLFLFIWLLT